MSASRYTVLVLIDKSEDNIERVEVNTERIESIDALKNLIEERFELEKGYISRLQIWDKTFSSYTNLKKVEEIQDKCKINAVPMVSVNDLVTMHTILMQRKPVSERTRTQVPPEAEEPIPDFKKPPEVKLS